jgi:uncharacterized RDD family membrane protein YckC
MCMSRRFDSWRYIVSTIVDFTIFCSLVFLSLSLYAGALRLIETDSHNPSSSINNLVITALILFLWIFYFFLPVRIFGRTIGLKTLNLIITSSKSDRLSTRQSIPWAILLAIPVAVLFDILHALVFPYKTLLETQTGSQIVQLGISK